MTITVRYGAQRQQFGPAEGREVAVLDYTSQQLKLMPMLATCYALHFTAAFLVEQYAQAKRTKEEELVADVHSLSAGQSISCQQHQHLCISSFPFLPSSIIICPVCGLALPGSPDLPTLQHNMYLHAVVPTHLMHSCTVELVQAYKHTATLIAVDAYMHAFGAHP